jgi:hypothetical protein
MYTSFFGVRNQSREHELARRFIGAVATIAACLCPTLAFGQTNSTWNGGTGNWSNALNWNDGVPNGNYNALITPAGSSVALDINATIVDLTLGPTTSLEIGSGNTLTCQDLQTDPANPSQLNVNGGSLVVNGSFSNGYLNVTRINTGSSVTVNGVLNNGGSIQLSQSTMTVNGNVTTPLSEDTPLLSVANGSILNIQGTYTQESSISNDFSINGDSSVHISGDLNNIGDNVGSVSVAGGSVLNIQGSYKQGGFSDHELSIGGESSVYIAGSLNSSGGDGGPTSVSVTGGSTLKVEGNLDNSSSSAYYASNVTISGGSALTAGSFTNEAGSHFIVGDGLTPGSVANIGMLVNDGAIVLYNNGTTLSVSGVMTNDGTITIGKVGTPGSSVPNELVLGASSVNSGTITLSGSDSHIADSIITGATASVVLTNEKIIQGGGSLGDGSMGLINNSTGRILANSATPLNIDVSSAGFQNDGTLQVSKADTLIITGATNSFLNFDSSTGTLTGGTYLVTGTLQFDNANIVTNAASITLSGTTSSIEDQHGNDALANFATNASAGTFILGSDRNFTTFGAFSNAGKLTISTGSTFTVGGANSFTQTAGTTIVSGSVAVASPGGANVSGGAVFGTGRITGNIDLTGGLLSPGAASKKAGELTVSGAYTQSGAGAFDADLGGTTAGTQYDVLDITSTATLGGVLNVDLISGFKPTVGETFDIMDYSSETGTFTTLNLPKLTGGDTWSISYNPTDVVLTVDAPAAAQGAVSASPAKRVSRRLTPDAQASTQQPAAILSRVTCFAARLLGLTSCGRESIPSYANHADLHFASVAAGSGTPHNNVMVTTRSISARGGDSHEASATATAMTRLYVCAYLPPSIVHTMGCD